jgi:hypothetical protein
MRFTDSFLAACFLTVNGWIHNRPAHNGCAQMLAQAYRLIWPPRRIYFHTGVIFLRPSFFRMTGLLIAGSLVPLLLSAATTNSNDKVPARRDLGDIRRAVEVLRGKKFVREVPAYDISQKELRAISDREIEKQRPGQSLADYTEFLEWLDVVPPKTDLKAAYSEFLVDQTAGLYDSEAKEMCICSFQTTRTNGGQRPAEKKLEAFSTVFDDVVFAHEYTHALEDQYWPIDDPKDNDTHASTDRGEAHSFLLEGSATRLMIEIIPALAERNSPGTYFPLWNLIHSGMGETALNYGLGQVWKSSDMKVAGVPETLSRMEGMPYSYGYSFCAGLRRKWGLDGLDYIYDHPPVSTEQVMHPEKVWEWRDFPVQISLPETLPGGWEQVSGDSFGEAGMAVFFGCQFKNLNRGLDLARGWDGDHANLYREPEGHKLIVWASAWDSAAAAERFAGACVKERRQKDDAVITRRTKGRVEWKRHDGRVGLVLQTGKQVILMETDKPESLADATAWSTSINFVQPAEDAARDASNSGFRRFNPLFSWRKDGDYTVSKTLWGLLSRHDRNSVGSADRLLLGVVGESRRTISLNKWQVGAGLVAKHQSEARQGITKTTLLPWGILGSHFSTPAPQVPTNSLTRTSVVWGLVGSGSSDEAGRHKLQILPAGLLLRRTTGPGEAAFHVLGTGVSRREATDHSGSIARYHLFGIRVWTRHTDGELLKIEN